MGDLSPAAQAIKDAAFDAYWLFHPAQAAAILRAAADQMVPFTDPTKPEPGTRASHKCQQRLAIRRQLLAIAAELRGTPAP